jgi:DnaJ-domain-containing protein 1
MNQVRFYVPWKIGKGTALAMPPSFPELFPGVDDDVALLLQDENDQKFAAMYNRQRNEIPMQGLISWVRNFAPLTGCDVIFELIDSHTRLFRIALDREGPKPTDGLYLGKRKDALGLFPTDRNYFLPIQDLVTHVFICGVTGTGKTVLGKSIIEEAILKKIPAIIVDLKGDLSSLGLIFSSLEDREFEPWVEVRAGANRRDVVRSEVEEYKKNLTSFGLTPEDMERLKSGASFGVFTPKVGKGIPLAIASPLAAPPDIADLLKRDYETVLTMIGAFSSTFVKTLFPELKPSKLKKYKSFLEQLVQFCWTENVNLQGQDGLRKIQKLILNPPFEKLGEMPIDMFIEPKYRIELANRVAMCLSGEEQLWFKGVPLDVDLLLSRPSSDLVPISIINLRELSSFDDQMHALSHLTYAIYDWARRKGDSAGMPRLLFFIDEIGGGGGRDAFFPSHPYDPPSKSGLNLLLRRGRAFGLCCIFATQNPGDVDYKGLSNCQTWMVSRLQTRLDRDKIRQGMSVAEIHIESMDDKLRDLQPSEFLVRSKTGGTTVIHERWLMSYHKTLSEADVARINNPQILKWFEKYSVDDKPNESASHSYEIDYYDILEVSPKASIEVIEKAYKALAMKYHPDTAAKTMSRKEAEEIMKKLNEAYEILSDPALRASYDRKRQIHATRI